jgi:pimeloyl-ACP methyl ester carboxylesterase
MAWKFATKGMAILILLLFLTDILSLGIIVADIYLLEEFYTYRHTAADDYAKRCLMGGIALTSFVLLGKFPLIWLLSKRRKNEDQPTLERSGRTDELERPDGSRIHIEYCGAKDAQAIIFVHGWNANSLEWYYQKKFFQKDYRLILIDLPGLGKSKRPNNRNYSLSKMADDLEAVIRHTKAEKPILYGHSIGGMIILTYCARHAGTLRSRIGALVLQHTTYTNPVRTTIMSKLMTAIQKPVLVPLCYLMIFLSPIFWLMRWMSYLNGNSQVMTRFLTFTGTQTARQLDFISLLSATCPPSVMARGVLGMFRYDVTADLQHIDIPTLVIAADKDRLTKPDASRFIRENIKSAELFVAAPAGHQGLIERNKEVNEAVKIFLNNVQIRRYANVQMGQA